MDVSIILELLFELLKVLGGLIFVVGVMYGLMWMGFLFYYTVILFKDLLKDNPFTKKNK